MALEYMPLLGVDTTMSWGQTAVIWYFEPPKNRPQVQYTISSIWYFDPKVKFPS